MRESTFASSVTPIELHGRTVPGPSVAVVGTFDGVHVGHRRLVSMAVDEARAGGLTAIAVTFDPHPLRLVAPEQEPQLLTTTPARVRLLREAGAEAVAVVPFTPDTAALSPREFVEHVLVSQLQVHIAIVGGNFRFGRRGAGTPDVLAELLAGSGGTARTSDLVELDGTIVSSTEIRNRIGRGDVRWASRVLGRPHEIPLIELPGTPAGSYTSGRDLQIPAAGRYAGAARLDRWVPAEIDVLPQRRIEVHVDPSLESGGVTLLRFERPIQVNTNPMLGHE